MDKIVLLTSKEKDDCIAATEALKRYAPLLISQGLTIAKIRKAHYDAYLAEGFSDTQALALCQNVSL